mmetsp:Transcript_86556/g.193569  ORF Transcript_86556/g.193569 Transcript_86556/m.193569 type:complete len:246 (-) Transcript_86556:584-1321(-)
MSKQPLRSFPVFTASRSSHCMRGGSPDARHFSGSSLSAALHCSCKVARPSRRARSSKSSTQPLRSFSRSHSRCRAFRSSLAAASLAARAASLAARFFSLSVAATFSTRASRCSFAELTSLDSCLVKIAHGPSVSSPGPANVLATTALKLSPSLRHSAAVRVPARSSLMSSHTARRWPRTAMVVRKRCQGTPGGRASSSKTFGTAAGISDVIFCISLTTDCTIECSTFVASCTAAAALRRRSAERA